MDEQISKLIEALNKTNENISTLTNALSNQTHLGGRQSFYFDDRLIERYLVAIIKILLNRIDENELKQLRIL